MSELPCGWVTTRGARFDNTNHLMRDEAIVTEAQFLGLPSAEDVDALR
jgi:hypothetical protein